MACHRHLLDRAGRWRLLLLSANQLIYVLATLLLVGLVPRVDGKYLEDCEKVLLFPGSSSDIALSCKLRTINSEFDKINLTILDESVTKLNLECSNVLFYQSSLKAGDLQHLTRLQELHVEHCKLSRLSPGVFSGLSGLKNLTIRTHNTAWPALSLDIASGVFSEMNQLEKIDISENNIWTFTDKLFCLENLNVLNVSLNRLQDISDLGFREREKIGGCRPGRLEILDVSSNRLILMPDKALGKLPNLKELYLQGNEISMVSDGAFSGLKSLRVVNCSMNKL